MHINGWSELFRVLLGGLLIACLAETFHNVCCSTHSQSASATHFIYLYIHTPMYIELPYRVTCGYPIACLYVLMWYVSQVNWTEGRDMWFHDAIDAAKEECECEWMDVEDPLFMLYTRYPVGPTV